MYALLAKEFPFVAEKEDKLFELIKKGEVDLSRPRLKDISKSGKFNTIICELIGNKVKFR